MQELVQLLALGAFLAGLSALIVARVRQRWLVPFILLWLFAPVIPMVMIFGLGALFSPAAGSGLYAVVFAVMLIGTIILLPWLAAAGIGIAIGLAFRRKRAPVEMPMLVVSEAQASPPAKSHFSQSSPDGSIRIDIDPVEWASGQFVHTPRVVEAASGRILCDLLGSDWEAHTAFPRDRYVWLGLRRYRTPGHLFAEFDLSADRYRIALNSLETPDEEGPLGDISARLEHWWKQAAAVAPVGKETPASVPGPFAAWRIALLILVGAVAAIAALTYLSMRYDIDPPDVPVVPHIPRMGR